MTLMGPPPFPFSQPAHAPHAPLAGKSQALTERSRGSEAG